MVNYHVIFLELIYALRADVCSLPFQFGGSRIVKEQFELADSIFHREKSCLAAQRCSNPMFLPKACKLTLCKARVSWTPGNFVCWTLLQSMVSGIEYSHHPA